MWGQRICDPGPLYIRAQGSSRGKILSRTCNESPNSLEIKPRTMLSSASQSAPGRKGKYSIGTVHGKAKHLCIDGKRTPEQCGNKGQGKGYHYCD